MTTETKSALKTTEFVLAIVVIALTLVSFYLIGGDTGGDSGGDEFIARQAWLYVAIVPGAYCVGRGLAKAGSSDPYTDDHQR